MPRRKATDVKDVGDAARKLYELREALSKNRDSMYSIIAIAREVGLPKAVFTNIQSKGELLYEVITLGVRVVLLR